MAEAELFRSFWAARPLSAYERLCLTSFVRHGHRLRVYSYDETLAVPPGIELADAAEIVPRPDFFVSSDGPDPGSPSTFSNRFRYELLARHGGWWVDMDVVCLTAAIPAGEIFFACEEFDSALDGCMAPGTMKFPPRHPVMLRCAEQARRAGPHTRWGELGPNLFTAVLTACGLRAQAAPRACCYPVHYDELARLFDPAAADELEQQLAGAVFLHLYNSLLRKSRAVKDTAPPPGSLLARLFARYNVEPAP